MSDIFQESNFFRSFDFMSDFEQILRAVENQAKVFENKKKTEMRSYEDSAKSKKTVASMIENNNSKEAKRVTAKQQTSPKANGGSQSRAVDMTDENGDIDEETRLANLNALKLKKGGGVKKGMLNVHGFSHVMLFSDLINELTNLILT